MPWCFEANRDEDFIAALDMHAFRDEARVMGKLGHELGNAHELAGPAPHNSTVLFHLLTQAPDDPLPDGVTVESLREADEHIRSVVEPLGRARMDREDAEITSDEFANAARMMLHACRGYGDARRHPGLHRNSGGAGCRDEYHSGRAPAPVDRA